MADRERLEAALRAAHAAGDVEAARRIASELRAPSQPLETAPTIVPVRPSSIPSDIPQVIGQEESGAPMLAEPEPYTGPPTRMRERSFQAEGARTGDQLRIAAGFLLNTDPEARRDIIRNTLGEEASFEKDEEGRDIVTYRGEKAYINRPGFGMDDATQLAFEFLKFAPAAKFARYVGGPALSMFGRAGPSSLRAAIGGAPAAMLTQGASDIASEQFGSEQGVDPLGVMAAGAGAAGGELIGGRLQAFTPQARAVMDRIRRLGIDPKGTPGAQVQQVSEAAERMVPFTERGSALEDVAQGVRAARETTRQSASRLYGIAEETTAAVPRNQVTDLSNRVSRDLDRFDLGADGMSAIARRVAELEEMASSSVPFPRMLQDMERWRRRVSSMSPKDGSPAEAAAKRASEIYDEWLDGIFNNDMVIGNPEDISKWRNARQAWADYKRRFDSNRVVRDMARKETTPEQMSQWLFNANAVGAKREAGLVVQRLNDILGADSQQMAGLRSEVVLDLAEPLFRETPDIQAFTNNYRKYLRNNKTLKDNLFPGEYGEELDDLYRFAQSIARRPGTRPVDLNPADIGGRVINFINRIYLGHGIARGGARIEGGNIIANSIRRSTSGSAARINMIRDYLGIEPTAPLIPLPTAAGAAALTSEIE